MRQNGPDFQGVILPSRLSAFTTCLLDLLQRLWPASGNPWICIFRPTQLRLIRAQGRQVRRRSCR